MSIIKKFSDGSFLEYAQGSFDPWCVFLTRPGQNRRPPRDMDYFQELLQFSAKYGIDKIYDDYVTIYDLITRDVQQIVLDQIDTISSTYEDEDKLDISILYTILYLAMIAEEKKENTRLGKRIKRLGIHKLLIEKQTVHHAANCMRGMNWKAIDALCSERGFEI